MYFLELDGPGGNAKFHSTIHRMFDSQIIDQAHRFANGESSGLGCLEQDLREQINQRLSSVLEKAMQARADRVENRCPKCGSKLTKRRRTKRIIKTMSGSITIKRWGGYCAKCKCRVHPADELLGIEKGHSPMAQEVAALFACKMPLSEASAVMKRATGIDLPTASLDRLVKKVSKDAQASLKKLNQQTLRGEFGIDATPVKTLVIEIDAWNIRERDDWGKSQELRRRGKEPSRWHWVWTGTVFSLDQRFEKNKRPIIIERGYVATREGLEAFREELYAEAMRRGLGQAERVLIIADGAAWIWNLATDRFKEAEQRLDYFHLQEHLWAVARQLYPEEKKAKQWMARKKKQLNAGRAIKVINQIEEAVNQINQPDLRKPLEKQLNYFKEHKERMDYDQAKARGEPQGSGAIESTCRQYQCRFKRPGQFW